MLNASAVDGQPSPADCLSQNCLIRPPPSAASSELAVYDDTIDATAVATLRQEGIV